MQTSLEGYEGALERQLELWQGLQRQRQLMSRNKFTGGHGHLHGSGLQTLAGVYSWPLPCCEHLIFRKL